ncbi:MAG: hypothetical protein ACYTF3_02200 [Planctomycetota bacterium]|jgi:hypothetical protein
MRTSTVPLAAVLAALVLVACGGAPEARPETAAPGTQSAGESRYEAFPMLEKYIGEHVPPGYKGEVVRYLDAGERAKLRVSVKDGRLVYPDGTVLDPQLDAHPERGGFGTYVMAPDGAIYVTFDFEQGAFHHSSLLAGAPVAAAGEMTIIDGEIIDVSNSSGHYKPPPRCIDQVLTELDRLGYDTTNVERKEWGKRQKVKALEETEPEADE